MIGDVGVRAFGLKASGGRRSWASDDAGDGGDGENAGRVEAFDAAANVDAANKLFVGLLIMLIFSEALAL